MNLLQYPCYVCFCKNINWLQERWSLISFLASQQQCFDESPLNWSSQGPCQNSSISFRSGRCTKELMRLQLNTMLYCFLEQWKLEQGQRTNDSLWRKSTGVLIGSYILNGFKDIPELDVFLLLISNFLGFKENFLENEKSMVFSFRTQNWLLKSILLLISSTFCFKEQIQAHFDSYLNKIPFQNYSILGMD